MEVFLAVFLAPGILIICAYGSTCSHYIHKLADTGKKYSVFSKPDKHVISVFGFLKTSQTNYSWA